MNDTTFKNKEVTKLFPKKTNFKKNSDNENLINQENDIDDENYEYYARIFLEKYKLIKVVNKGYFICFNNFWRFIDEKNIKDYVTNIHPKDNIKNRNEITSFIVSIKTKEPIIDQPPLWDKTILPEEIIFRNGVLNIHTGVIRPVVPEDYAVSYIPHDYDPTIDCPLWKKTVSEWLSGNQLLALQEFFGYILYSRVTFKKCLLVYGPTGTGKTRPLLIAKHMVGDQNVCCINPESMENPNIMSEIFGRKLNVGDELSQKSKLNDGFRRVIDGNPTSINEKYKPRITISPVAKHIFTTNILPKMSTNALEIGANLDRLLIIEFNNKIKVKDGDLTEKLYAEIQGIINWAIEGLKRLLINKKFTDDGINQELIEDYKSDNIDDLEFFITKTNTFEFDPTFEITKKDFFEEFMKFLYPPPLIAPGSTKWNPICIGRRMKSLNFLPFQKGGKIPMYKGLRKILENQKEIVHEISNGKPNIKLPNF